MPMTGLINLTNALAIAFALPAAAQSGGGNLEIMMSRIDLDGDGAFSRAEMDALQSAHFATLDFDGDGRISKAEFVDPARRHDGDGTAERMTRRFTNFDRDGDGYATVTEFRALGRLQFERLDADANGLVTLDEFHDLAERLAELLSG